MQDLDARSGCKKGHMARALITGGAGFIGCHLSEALLERGWTVGVVDDLSTGSIENISHLKGHPHFSYVLDSVMNRSLMLEQVDRADVIFHLAAAVGVRLIVEKPVYTIETNIKATELILERAARKQKPLLLASTSPQRRAILTQLGIPFDVVEPRYEEHDPPEADATELVCEHARGKAASVAINSS